MDFKGIIDGTKTKVKATKLSGGAETLRTFLTFSAIVPYTTEVASFIESHQREALVFNIEAAQEELEI